MRLIFLGTSSFAVPSLQALLARTSESGDGLQIIAVITQPDRPSGRGLRLTAPPVKVAAERSGIPVLQPERLRSDPSVITLLELTRPDLLIVAAYGQIIPAAVFEFPPLGTLNLHASLLPRYRGAAPIARAIWNGERETGVSIMKIDSGLDTGPVLSSRRTAIDDQMTSEELESRLAELGAQLLVETLGPYAAGNLQPRPQDDSQATWAQRLTKEEAPIDWQQPARAVHNQIRALNPWPVATASLRSETVKIWRSRIIGPESERAGAAEPGRLLAIGSRSLRVACGQGTTIALTELQWPNRRRMPALDFSNGLGLQAGERFS